MNTITYSQRYIPHKLETKFYATKLYRSGYSVDFVCRRYHISKSSLMRWNKKFDGTKGSLIDKSHRPKTPHPNAHTEQELKYIPYSNAPLTSTSLVSLRVWDGRRDGLASHTLTATRRILRQFHLTFARNIF